MINGPVLPRPRSNFGLDPQANNGYKISKIAKLKETEIPLVVREIVAKSSTKNHAINAFKLSMINFDISLFQNTYNNLLAENHFGRFFGNTLFLC